MNIKHFNIVFETVVSLVFISCGPAPQGTPDDAPIEIREDPYQAKLFNEPPISITKDGYVIDLSPKAEYNLKGIVLSKKNYDSEWNSQISPCDLAVAWGDLVKSSLYQKIKWSQSGRWYFWRYDEEFPYDNNFISKNSANTHAIPANDTVKAALMKVRKGDTIDAFGYLVYITAKKGQAEYWWNSSLSRDDGGDGSCEIMYIIDIKYRGMLYK